MGIMKKTAGFFAFLGTVSWSVISGCGAPAVVGNGVITERDVDPGSVSQLKVGGEWLVTILPDAEQEQCVVVIDENLQSEISAENSAGLLTVRVNASIRLAAME